MKVSITAISLSAILLAGCATGYQPRSLMGGFSETRLAPDIARITFLGNSSTSKERAQDFTLLRAAELSIENGYPYFAILSENMETHQSSYTGQGYAQTSGKVNVTGNQAHYSAQTTYQPGQTLIVKNPEAGVVVKMLKQKNESDAIYDAKFLVETLKSKYKIP